MRRDDPLIPKHGGYRKLKSFQVARLVYDVTVRFCDCYVGKRSRTHDQMVQAARSGVQNIAEGSQASGTSKKTELKLTNVARASLEELRLDYEDFLRQRGLAMWEPSHPALMRFKAKRCATLDEVRAWVEEEKKHGRTRTDAGGHGQIGKATDGLGKMEKTTDGHEKMEKTRDSMEPQNEGALSVPVGVGPCSSVSSPILIANAALSLLNLCCHLLDRQLAAQSKAFVDQGGFSERLYQTRQSRRRNE